MTTQSLNDLLTGVDLSATIDKEVQSLAVCSLLDLPPGAVKTYTVSKPGNWETRFKQPGVLRDRPLVGIGLCSLNHPLEKYVSPAKKQLTESDIFELFAIAMKDANGLWEIPVVLRKVGSKIDSTLGGLASAAKVVEVVPLIPLNTPIPTPHKYDLEKLLKETGITEEAALDWLERLGRKRQIVLYGPPGTGKTWIAERLARFWTEPTQGQFQTVQFHPGFTYEDFFAGPALRASDSGQLVYNVEPGILLDFCAIAAENADAQFVLVIDEINRADLGRTLGEVLHVLEYREKPIKLANGPGDGDFTMPKNVYLIGTMNSADRSTAVVDHALRRRFSFIRIAPDHEILLRALAADGIDGAPLIDLLKKLNAAINDEDYELGISFFLGHGSALKSRLPAIWDGEVYPYLKEFFFGQREQLERWHWRKVSALDLETWFPAGH